ncbi:transposase [Nannocystis sp.]|uniref:transposase n=1 Tax=Nannocystis sp. TaxID=1962667 RepID=UPI00344F107F|nr:transposase [Nannocystis sp.]
MRVHFKAAWRSGAAHADMSADKFIARLSALVPPPGFHMTRYFGVFANRHHLRARIIPPSPVPTPGQQLALGLAASANDKPDDDTESSPRPPQHRLGQAPRPRVRRRRHPLSQVRWPHAHPRGR